LEQVPIAVSQSANPAVAWNASVMTSVNPLPLGTNYLAFNLQPVNTSWSVEVGEVDISGDSGLTAGTKSALSPSGVTVLAGAAEVYVNWLGVPGAAAYQVRRGTDGTVFTIIATDVKGNCYIDDDVKPGSDYYYSVAAVDANGDTGISDSVGGSPKSGIDLIVDPLTDWSKTSDHMAGLSVNNNLSGAVVVKRTKKIAQSFTYRAQGAKDFAFNSYYRGKLAGQVAVDVSADGNTWTPVTLAYSDPVKVDKEWSVAVCSPLNKLPAGSNYLRFNLLGESLSADTPAVSQVRLTHGSLSVASSQ
jgi:hypothetical protein